MEAQRLYMPNEWAVVDECIRMRNTTLRRMVRILSDGGGRDLFEVSSGETDDFAQVGVRDKAQGAETDLVLVRFKATENTGLKRRRVWDPLDYEASDLTIPTGPYIEPVVGTDGFTMNLFDYRDSLREAIFFLTNKLRDYAASNSIQIDLGMPVIGAAITAFPVTSEADL